MEQRYKSLSLFEFQEMFPDDQSCMEHLAKLKWPEGFICEKCGHRKYCNGKLEQTPNVLHVEARQPLQAEQCFTRSNFLY